MTATALSTGAPLASGKSEWRGAWRLVVAGTICGGLPAMGTFSLGLLVEPLHKAFGWSRAEVSAPVLITSVCAFLLGPFVGYLTERFGPRRVGLTGAAIFCAALASVGFTGPSILSWYLAWIGVGVGMVSGGPIAWTASVIRRFHTSRGLALAVVLSGMGLIGSFVPPIVMFMLEIGGWRSALWALAAIGICVSWPIAFFLFRDPEATGPLRRVVQTASHAPEGPRGFELGFSEALRTSRFWRLLVSTLAVPMGLSFMLVHLAPILGDAGMSRENAVVIVSIVGPMSFLARVVGGYFLDRMFAPLFGALIFTLNAVSCVLLLNFDGSMAQAVVIGISAGIGIGVDLELVAYLVSRYFGARAFSRLYGLLVGVYGVGFGSGALIGGRVYDVTGTYGPMLQVLIFVFVLSALLTGTLGRFPTAADSRSGAAAKSGART